MSNDHGNNSESRWRTTVGDDVEDDVGDDVGDGDNGGGNAGADAIEGDGGDTGGEGGGAPGEGCGSGGGGDSGGGGGCILLGLFLFYCEDIFVWYFYVWGESARSHFPSHSRHA